MEPHKNMDVPIFPHLKTHIRKLFVEREPGDLRAYIAKEAVGTFLLQISSTGLVLIASVILARLLGPTGYGTYAYAMAWVMVLFIPANLGINNLLIREIASYRSQSSWGLLKGVLRWGHIGVFISSLTVALLAAGVAWFLFKTATPVALTFWIALIYLPFHSQNSVYSSAMCGLKHVVLGQIPVNLVRPLVFLGLLSGLQLSGIIAITPTRIMGLNVIAAAVALIVGRLLLKRYTPTEVATAQPIYTPRVWLRSMVSFIFIGGMFAVNNRADVIMLGVLIGTEPAGVYQIASRGAGLVTLILMAINSPLGPAIASLHKQQDKLRLQRIVTQSARAALIATLLLVTGLVVFRHWFMLIFGPGFIKGTTALVILSMGQLINVAIGSVGLLLNMSGHERFSAVGVGLAALLNIVLNAAFIPVWGINGAAIATVTSMVTWNVLLAIGVHRKLNIHPTALGVIKLKKST